MNRRKRAILFSFLVLSFVLSVTATDLLFYAETPALYCGNGTYNGTECYEGGTLYYNETSLTSDGTGGWVNDSVSTNTTLDIVGSSLLLLKDGRSNFDNGIWYNETYIVSKAPNNEMTNRTRPMVFYVNSTPPSGGGSDWTYETFLFRDNRRIYLCMRGDGTMQFGACNTPDGMVLFGGYTTSNYLFNVISTLNTSGTPIFSELNVTTAMLIGPKVCTAASLGCRTPLQLWGIAYQPQWNIAANVTRVAGLVVSNFLPTTGASALLAHYNVGVWLKGTQDSGTAKITENHRVGIQIDRMGISVTGIRRVMNMTSILVQPNTRANQTNREVWLNSTAAISFGDGDESEAIYSSTSDQLDIMANTSVNVSSTLSVTKNLVVFGNVSMKRPYGMFSDTTNQTIGATGTAQVINFSTTEDSHQITLQNNSNFTFAQSGDYLIEVSAIFDMSIANRHVELWMRKNNTDVPRSNTIMHVPSASAETVLAVPFIIDVTPSDYISFYWASDDSSAKLLTTSASSYSPASPSIIVTMSKISETTP